MTRRARQRPPRRRRSRWRLLFALALVTGVAGGALFWMRDLERDERLDALERTRDELRARLASLRAKDAVVASAPEGDVLIGIPETVGSDLVRHAAAAFLGRVEIELHDLQVHKAGTIRVGTPVGRMTPGDYELDVRIQSVSGTLEPGAPRVRFRGRWIDVETPVRLSRGEGRAALRLKWDSRGIAGAFCQAFETRLKVTGTLVPRTYVVAGRLDGRLSEGTLTAVPSFPDLEVNLQVEPSPQTWKALDHVLDQRGFRCRTALKLVDVPGEIRRVLEKGFNVRVPRTIVKPLSFPAALRRELTWEGRHARLQVTPRKLEVTPGLVWYSADVSTEKTETTPAASAILAPTAEPAPTLTPEPAPAPEATPAPMPTPEATPAPTPTPTATPAPTTVPSPSTLVPEALPPVPSPDELPPPPDSRDSVPGRC